MKFQVGDKVVPINKTVIGYGSLDRSNNWRKAKEKGQGFLFVSKFDEEVNAYVCSYKKNDEYGDYFNEIDLKNYKDKPTKNQRITALESVVKDLEQKIIDIRNDYRYDLKQVETRIKMLEFKLEEQTKLIPPTIQSVEEIIEFEGNRYRKVDREAKDGDVVVFKKTAKPEWVTVGKPYKACGFSFNGKLEFKDDLGEDCLVYDGFQTKHAIDDVDVYELIEQDGPPYAPIGFETVEKSTNQQRAEIIEKAKKFVEVKSECVKDSPYVEGGIARKKIENPNFYNYTTVEVEFIINQEKRTVVSLVKFNDGSIMTKGVAKCNPSDVFNEHIGKAIALGRALGLDVSEFENAVQPNEIVVGMVIKGNESENRFYRKSRKFTLTSETDHGGFYYKEASEYSGEPSNDYILSFQFGDILNDTNAQYEEVK
ncbi:hypothetical protein H9636_16165 [Ureibacillus sp. Re31]|uniref:Uncharacterized protein n=1 Tax=Ureibacillus galli TaxID=2762222 RepID=A0ABR8XG24_9BACL|nr:hypothetical protein [Ureibacillus galli]MBD8028184.1 hypothetical protein [Ureibacillus galli]